jgi:5-methylcytosine-specific restriction protein A
MGWETSARRSELPGDWSSIRRGVLESAGYRCTATMRNGQRCHDKATDVDHIRPGADHRPANLQALCAWHHKRKTAAEAAAARVSGNQRHPREKHPGIR